MIELSRRALLMGSAAAAVAASALPARATAPVTAKQAPAFYRYKVGDFEVTSVSDGARTFPMPDGFVKNAPKE